MAKKKTNLEKLKTEIQLQESKMTTLQLLAQELDQKIARLQSQRQALGEKYKKLQFAHQQNVARIQPSPKK